VDLLKIGFGQTFNNDFSKTAGSTNVKFLEVDLTVSVVVNEKNAFITGASFSQKNLQLFPNSQYSSLNSTTLKLGLASNFNDKWSSTIVLLPKIASDYKNISGDDFYMGGFALLKLKKRKTSSIVFECMQLPKLLDFSQPPFLAGII
jgi:long-subunit fatty acid transport protein